MRWILPYQGRYWEFDDSRLTAAEARLQKRLTGGSTPSVAGASRFELDPDAVVAALVIARRRAGLSVEEAVSIDDELLDLTAVAEATEAAVKAARAPGGGVEDDEIVRAEPFGDEPVTKRARKTAS
jgi:hypothetical protein